MSQLELLLGCPGDRCLHAAAAFGTLAQSAKVRAQAGKSTVSKIVQMLRRGVDERNMAAWSLHILSDHEDTRQRLKDNGVVAALCEALAPPHMQGAAETPQETPEQRAAKLEEAQAAAASRVHAALALGNLFLDGTFEALDVLPGLEGLLLMLEAPCEQEQEAAALAVVLAAQRLRGDEKQDGKATVDRVEALRLLLERAGAPGAHRAASLAQKHVSDMVRRGAWRVREGGPLADRVGLLD